MKKIFGIILFLIAFAIGADVKPFVFENIPNNGSAQQVEWDILMKYKIYGQNGITFKGGRIFVPDKSGWFGTSKGDFDVSGGNQDHLVGGPILIGGNMMFNDGHDTISTGPVRVLGNVTVGNFNSPNVINGTQCVSGTVPQKYINEVPVENRYFNENYESCPPEVPQIDTNLTIPVFLDTFTYKTGINLDNSTDYIDVPAGEGTYDYYVNKITMTNNSRLVIRMPLGGRLTRVFLKEGFSFSAHPKISIMYMAEDAEFVDGHWTGSGSIINNKDYSGNLLFYTTKDIIWPAINSTDSIQGTFITTGQISIEQHMTLAGQLLANKISINFNFDGSGFLYVPFDPPVLNIDPTALANGRFVENNKNVIIPIHLDTLAKTDVYFKYCFILDDIVTQDDFNVAVPECNNDVDSVFIPAGDSLPKNNIYLNVKADGISEGDEILKFHIFDLQGAVMPGNVKSGDFKLILADPFGFGIDTTWNYSFFENDSGLVDKIRVIGKSDSTKFRLDSAAHGIYILNSITGELTLTKPLDHELVPFDTIKVTVTDTSGLTDTRYIPIAIKDVNEAPTLNDVSIELKENNDITKSINTLIAIDVDTTSEFTQNIFSLLEGDTSIFRLDTAGELWAKKTFDYETDQKTYTLKVLVQDKNDPTLKDSAIVTVNITNSNDGPKFDTHNTTFYVDENEPFKDSVKATDQDGDKITYSIVGTVPFRIDDFTGVITSTRTFDYEKEIGFTFKVVVYDGTLKDTMNVNVLVNDVNEQLFVDDASFDIDEGKVDTLGKINAWDDDGPKDTIKFTCDDTVHYHIDNLSGVIILLEPFDYETQNVDTLIVYVNTKNGDKDSAKVIININDVNEPPVLQPNDTLHVDENCDSCFVGIITAIDPDKDDTLFYDVEESGFKIDNTGKLTTTKPFDHETTPTVTITVVVKDKADNKNTLKYVITITDVNEPVHVEENTCKVKENYTGKICTIVGYDEDIPSTVIFDISVKTKYDIDDNGVISVIKPFDFETVDKDSVKVYVIDTRDSTIKDSAWIKIIVENVEEKVNITEWDKNPPPDTVKTNDPDHEFKWTICEGDSCTTHYDNPKIHKDTTIKVCNDKKTVCDSIVVLFNDAPPVVTLTNAKSTDALIDYITIEEEKDDKIYVNKKDNKLKVTVRDTIHKTEKTFPIDVKLDTLHVSSKNVTEYNYLIDESLATYTQIGGGLIEVKEVVKDGDRKITLTKIVDKKMNPIDTVQTVTYTVKQDGKELTITYKTDNLTGQRVSDYEVSYKVDSCTTVSYYLGDDKKITKNKEGNIAFTVSYVYTDDFGNKASSKVDIIYDNIPPKVEILEPIANSSYNRNAIPVKWTVNGEVQDTLTLQRIERGVNYVIRRYVDKAGNVSADTVMVIMKEAKDIAIEVVNPVTMVDQDKVDEYYSAGHKYNDKKPYDVKFVDPKNDTIPDVIGVGFKVDIVLPSVSPTGSLATLDDITKNGQIPVDDNGNIVGASTHGIPVDQYVEEHCTEEFQKEYKKNGLNIPLYDVTYNLHLWVYTNNANYVNDFNIEFTLNDEAKTTSAGTVQMVIDWLADRDGNVKAKNHHSLGTGAYITKLFSKSVAKHRCDYKNQKKSDKTVKKDDTMKVFGYKRPVVK